MLFLIFALPFGRGDPVAAAISRCKLNIRALGIPYRLLHASTNSLRDSESVLMLFLGIGVTCMYISWPYS